MRSKEIFIFMLMGLILITINLNFLNGEENNDDPGKLAYTVLKTADIHKSRGKIYEAGKMFLEAAMMYKKALTKEPGNSSYMQNFKYCLGTRGFIQIKKAQELLKEKKFNEAARYFKWAADAYSYALEELPDESNFKTNLDFAQYHGGTADFEARLNSNGKAPDLKIDDFKGGKIDLAVMKGKVIILEFWTGWCPSCKKSLPKLEKIYKALSSKGFEIIAVAMDKDKTWGKNGSDKKAIEISKAYSFKFGWGDKSVSIAYGNFNSVPTMMLIDKKGNLFRKIPYNEQSEANLTKLIRSLL